ncbi:unnamed protein product, partial [Mycena citricolor]
MLHALYPPGSRDESLNMVSWCFVKWLRHDNHTLFFEGLRAAQTPFVYDIGDEWNLKHPPSINSTGHLVFDTVGSLLQHWPNTRYHSGHTIAPGIIPAGTILYHGREDRDAPATREWAAFDAEFARLFCVRSSESEPCWLLTIMATRSLNVLYFDGSSATKEPDGPIDTQDVLTWGEIVPERSGFEWDYRRMDRLCDVGKSLGIDGFVRMQLNFEVILCDWLDGVETISFTRLAEEERFPHSGYSFMHSSVWHDHFPGETRVRLDLSQVISMYDTQLVPSLISRRASNKRDRHRLLGVSPEDVAAILERVGTISFSHLHSGSGVDWQSLLQTIRDRYSIRLEELRSLLRSHEAESAFSLVRVLLTPHRLHNVLPSEIDGNNTDWARPVFRSCATAFTRSLERLQARFTPSEDLLHAAVRETTREICRTLVSIWAEGTQASDLSHLQLKWASETESLMDWLGWADWTKCIPGCAAGGLRATTMSFSFSSSASTVLPSRPLAPHIPISSGCPACKSPLEFPVPNPAPRPGTLLKIRCFSCENVISHTFYPAQIPAFYTTSNSSPSASSSGAGPSGASGAQTPRKGRRFGTQEKPLETGYYDILGITPTATTDDVKKAYRRMAIKHHPDKNPDDPHAEERFKEIAIAYQTLSDEALRKKYNEFGSKESAPEGGFVDPEEVFGAIFGGDKFIPIIGTISLARDMKAALQEADEAEQEELEKAGTRLLDAKGRPIISEEEKAAKEAKEKIKAAEKAKVREERIKKLVENLERKLSIFTESATGPNDPDVLSSWRTISALEADQLKQESYGVELLQAIGFVYVSKAKAHLATSQTFLGVGGWLHNVQGKYHVFSETVSTLRSAIELKSVFDQIQAAERAGNMNPEEKRKLEEQAAEKGLQALFKGAKLEIESVLRETCERVLEDPNIPRSKSDLRAVALQVLGEAFINVNKDSLAIGDDSEYVRIETRKSRE